MTDEITGEMAGTDFVIRVSGRLDFYGHQPFRACYEAAPAAASRFVVDMSQITCLDTSALGMLLLLRDYASQRRRPVVVQAGTKPSCELLSAAGLDAVLTVLLATRPVGRR